MVCVWPGCEHVGLLEAREPLLGKLHARDGERRRDIELGDGGARRGAGVGDVEADVDGAVRRWPTSGPTVTCEYAKVGVAEAVAERVGGRAGEVLVGAAQARRCATG